MAKELRGALEELVAVDAELEVDGDVELCRRRLPQAVLRVLEQLQELHLLELLMDPEKLRGLPRKHEVVSVQDAPETVITMREDARV